MHTSTSKYTQRVFAHWCNLRRLLTSFNTAATATFTSETYTRTFRWGLLGWLRHVGYTVSPIPVWIQKSCRRFDRVTPVFFALKKTGVTRLKRRQDFRIHVGIGETVYPYTPRLFRPCANSTSGGWGAREYYYSLCQGCCRSPH